MNETTKQNNLNINLSKFEFANKYNQHNFDQIVGKPSTYLKDVFKRFFKNPWAVIFLIIFLIIVMFIIFVPIFSPYSAFHSVSSTNSAWAQNLRPRWHGGLINGYYKISLSQSAFDEIKTMYPNMIVDTIATIGKQQYVLINPYAHPDLANIYPLFGTDNNGIDVWTKTWVGARESLLMAIGVAIISVFIGAIYGAISGSFAGKWVDIVMMRIIEILSGVPTIMWLLLLSIVFSNKTTAGSLDNRSLFFSLIAIMWMSPASLTRMYILKTKDAEYIQAIRTLGGSQTRIIFVHMLPNIAGKLMVRLVHIVPVVIFFESTLVFLGLKSPTQLGLGTLINDGNAIQDYIAPLFLPALIMVLLTLSAQIIANNLNDSIDPRAEMKKG